MTRIIFDKIAGVNPRGEPTDNGTSTGMCAEMAASVASASPKQVAVEISNVVSQHIQIAARTLEEILQKLHRTQNT